MLEYLTQLVYVLCVPPHASLSLLCPSLSLSLSLSLCRYVMDEGALATIIFYYLNKQPFSANIVLKASVYVLALQCIKPIYKYIMWFKLFIGQKLFI